MGKSCTSPEETKAEQIVESCGGRPLGIQRGFGIAADLFLFKDEHGSTVGVPFANITEASVRSSLLNSKNRWVSAHRNYRHSSH